jgi:hypothetical protein
MNAGGTGEVRGHSRPAFGLADVLGIRMHYQWDFVFLLRYAPLFWNGVLVTLSSTGAFHAEIFAAASSRSRPASGTRHGRWDCDAGTWMPRVILPQAARRMIPVIPQPVNHAVEEHVPGVDDRGAGSAVQRHAGDGGYLSVAAGLHGGRPDLLRAAVSEHAAGSGIGAAVGVTAAVGNGLWRSVSGGSHSLARRDGRTSIFPPSFL